jgi:Fur family ferric uptake transcriptional regulator
MDKHSIQTTNNWETELSHSGYRITQPRRAILEIIAASPRPLTPMEIFNQARLVTPNIGLVTVYRTVEKLEEFKLIDRVHHHGQCQTVFRGTRSHQHLLICTECGSSAYFDGLKAEEQFTAIGNSHGYLVTSHWLQLSGLCQKCQKKENS